MNPPTSMRAVFRQLFLSVYLPSFLMSMCQGIVLLMLPLFALDLGANIGITALVFSLRGLGNVVADIPAGYCASRLGDKITMIIGVSIMVTTSLLASIAASPFELSIVAFAFGAGMAIWLLGRLTHISSAVPVIHRGRAIATMAGLQRFGGFIGPVTSGAIASIWGFEVVFLIVAGLSLIALILVVFCVPANVRQPDQKETTPLVKILPQTLVQYRSVFMTAGLAMFLLTIIRAARQLLIPLWGAFIGLSVAEIGVIMSIAAGVDMCMFPIAGYVMDRFGRKPAATTCLTLLAIGLSCVPFSDTSLSLTIAVIIAGAGNGIGSGINMTLGADFSPAHNRGEFLGVWRLVSDLGSFTGPMLVGLIAQVFVLATAFAITAAAGIAGVLIVQLWVRETLTLAADSPQAPLLNASKNNQPHTGFAEK